MKRYKNLFEKIIDIDNIKTAIIKASRNKTRRRAVKKVLNNLDEHAKIIQDILVNRTFKCSPYLERTIKDGSTQKERLIKQPKFFPDQCVHWALMNVVEPLFHKRLYQFSCSSIKGRGIFYCKDYVEYALKDNKRTKYAYQLDIKKFYPSINNDRLKTKLRRMFKDDGVIWLFDTIIDSDKGLPIGNYTSQWLANFYLTDLDMFVKHELKIPYYCRYADDLLILSSNKRKLHNARKRIEEFVANELLTIKDNWQVYKVDSRPIAYCGFRFFRGYTEIRDTHFLRIRRRVRKIAKAIWINYKNAAYMISQWGYIINTNSFNFYQKYIQPYVSINNCKEYISYYDSKINQ